MNLRRLTARTAVAGISTVLAAGALVGATGTAANAAPASNAYTCTVPGVGIVFDTTLTVDGSLPVPQYWAGAGVPAGLLNVTASVDPATAGMLGQYGATELHINDFAFDLATSKVPVPLAGPIANGSWAGTGSNKAFTTPAPGTAVGAKFPGAMTASTTIGGNPIDIPCVLKAGTTPSTLASIDLLQQTSAVTAPKLVKAKQGKAAKVKVSAKSISLGGPVAGNVVAKEGKKVVAKGKFSNKGVAVLKLSKKLKPGKHKLTITYAGTPSIKGSSAKTVVKVAKKK